MQPHDLLHAYPINVKLSLIIYCFTLFRFLQINKKIKKVKIIKKKIQIAI